MIGIELDVMSFFLQLHNLSFPLYIFVLNSSQVIVNLFNMSCNYFTLEIADFAATKP